MKIQINDSKKAFEWIEIFKFIKNLNQYVSFSIRMDEIYIQIMDGSHVCLVDITFPSSWFSLYECEKATTISVMSNVLVKVLSMYTSDTTIELSIGENEDKLEIHLLHDKQNKHFELNLIEIDQELLSPIIVETLLDFSIKSKAFDKYILELTNFGEDVEIKCSNEKLFLEACNEEGKYQIELEGENLEEFNVVENYDFSAKFPLKYICIISKLSITYTNVHLFLDESNPMRITFDNNQIKFNFFLAPKTED
jgi:proliferating cell nuclear antigen PCNA